MKQLRELPKVTDFETKLPGFRLCAHKHHEALCFTSYNEELLGLGLCQHHHSASEPWKGDRDTDKNGKSRSYPLLDNERESKCRGTQRTDEIKGTQRADALMHTWSPRERCFTSWGSRTVSFSHFDLWGKNGMLMVRLGHLGSNTAPGRSQEKDFMMSYAK